MHRSITITRSRLAAACAILAAAMTVSGPLAAQPGTAPQTRTLTVSGEGEVKAVPDEAILSAGVVSQSATAGEALTANRRAMNAVFAELKHQGIPDRSIRTSEFNVSPQYETGKDGNAPPRITSYQVSNSVSVTVDDLANLGPAIDAVVSSGANSMGGITFTIRDPKPLLNRAREAAVKDAMDRAQIYARAAGLTLGRVMQIGEGAAETPRPMFRAMNVMSSAPTPIAAGEQTVTAQVSMTFEIR